MFCYLFVCRSNPIQFLTVNVVEGNVQIYLMELVNKIRLVRFLMDVYYSHCSCPGVIIVGLLLLRLNFQGKCFVPLPNQHMYFILPLLLLLLLLLPLLILLLLPFPPPPSSVVLFSLIVRPLWIVFGLFCCSYCMLGLTSCCRTGRLKCVHILKGIVIGNKLLFIICFWSLGSCHRLLVSVPSRLGMCVSSRPCTAPSSYTWSFSCVSVRPSLTQTN